VNAVYGKIPGNRKLRSRETRLSNLLLYRKACKIGLSPPNWTLPVNNTVKKGRIDLESLKLFARSMDSATKPDIKKDRKSNGRSVSMAVSIEDRYRWKIGINGRSVSMESVTKTPIRVVSKGS
jgi:hypothetical protein